jgi:hypothetical protein
MKKKMYGLIVIVLSGLVMLCSAGCGSGGNNPSWSLKIEGARTESIGQDYFEDGASPDCHGIKYTDEQERVWEGIPLWYLAGRVDDNKIHKNGAFNDALADQGYEIEVIAGDRSAKFTSQEIKRNNNILVACKMNGTTLPVDTGPLMLVGSGVDNSRQVGQITSIKLSLSPR